jgi:hypothetical protein
LNQRLSILTDGPGAGAPRWRAWMSSITCLSASPAAKRCSASCLRCGQAYEPGRSLRFESGWRTRRKWSESAFSRRLPVTPAALHIRPMVSTKSRPVFFVRNAAALWAAQSHTLTPWVRKSRALGPSPAPAQTRHGGSFPSGSPL